MPLGGGCVDVLDASIERGLFSVRSPVDKKQRENGPMKGRIEAGRRRDAAHAGAKPAPFALPVHEWYNTRLPARPPPCRSQLAPARSG